MPRVADAASSPQLVAGPTTSLVDGQPILVGGTGFAPNTTLHLYECRIFSGCGSLDSSAVTDSSGRFSIVGHARRGFADDGTPVDCAVTQCFLTVSASTMDARASWQDMIRLPEVQIWLSYARPTVSVISNRRLADGQVVTVEGHGFVPGQTVYAYECSDLCTEFLPGRAVVGRDGRVSISRTVHRWIFEYMASGGDPPMDCSVSTPGCALTLALRGDYEDGYEKLAGADLYLPTPAIFTSSSAGPGAFFGLGPVVTWEGNVGTHPVTVRFGVTPSSNRPQVLHYRTLAWTATAADFQPIDGAVTLPPGATEGSLTVRVRGDTLVEGDEAFVVEFRGTRRLTDTRATAVVVIRDDAGG